MWHIVLRYADLRNGIGGASIGEQKQATLALRPPTAILRWRGPKGIRRMLRQSERVIAIGRRVYMLLKSV